MGIRVICLQLVWFLPGCAGFSACDASQGVAAGGERVARGDESYSVGELKTYPCPACEATGIVWEFE